VRKRVEEDEEKEIRIDDEDAAEGGATLQFLD
jgi:hypothetical protein